MPKNVRQIPTIGLSIKRIYLKDLSFEAPRSPAIFKKNWNPSVNLDLDRHSQKLTESIYEVVIGLRVTVRNNGGEREIVFLCELQQAGIFDVQPVPENRLASCLGIVCPNILFPYARETVSSVVVKGSFPQINLAPVNFGTFFANSPQEKSIQANKGERESRE